MIKKTKTTPRKVFGLWMTFQNDGFRPLEECATLLSESLIECVLENGKPDKVEWVVKPLDFPGTVFYGGDDSSFGWKAIYEEKDDVAVWEAIDAIKRKKVGGERMTREEAAELLWRVAYDKYGPDDNPMRQRDAADIVVTALREPAHEWVRTTDRLPTEEDAIEVHDEWGFTHKEVAVLSSGWPFEALVKDIPAMLPGIMDIETIENKTTTFPYWMPLPKLPEVEE